MTGARGPLSDNVKGALLMIGSMAGFAANDALIKLASAEMGLFQAILLRGVAASLLIAGLAAALGAFRRAPPRRDWKILALRSAGEVGATLCFLTALFNMPIANATAILQALPLAVTLAGALFLGEAVGWRRYLAIAVGFAGVLIIVRPGAEGFNSYALFAVAAVGFVVLRDLTTRRLSPETPSLLAASLTAVVITIVGGLGVALTGEWAALDAGRVDALAALAGAAVFIFFGYLFSIMTMRQGEVAFVAPFRYTNLIWAILLGLFVFGEVPDVYMMTGAAIVVGTGLYTFYRERRLQRSLALATARRGG
ncbi:MAG: DMT family transporter [Marivibrio sp.]|uniref:DMT family transporter n=1 Tax=Marivibrio sp. TaxID=2039719 RepID=UPI0032EF14D0